jgi:hypothetical protein
MASIIEVINGISQAVHAKHDGGAKIGLRRESEDLLQGVSIYDPRVMDGFGIQFSGDKLLVKYHSEVPLTDIHDKNFETDMRHLMKEITKFIKTEYRKVTKKGLGLVEHGDIQIMVQSANRRLAYVNAVQMYTISDIKVEKDEGYSTQYQDLAMNWLRQIKKV